MLKQANSNTQIAALMDQSSKVTKERDNLLQVLDSLGSTIRRRLGDLTRSELPSDTTSDPSQHTSLAQSTLGEQISPITTPRPTPETSNPRIVKLSINPTPPDLFTYNDLDYTFSNEPHPTTMAFDSFIHPSTESGLISTWSLSEIHTPL
ncbi:hypothetical protein FGADI_11466 [Fusarium gaditjirri]|uniref:Uncharacterized protein n=1 Tax=Fusarium gaditjirri TaxID=282569 RepID=A0A8H4WQ79_9HYPO|nr:hypothetical protein FGADI_11466 [Fusarium gaditjirri]